MNIHPLRRDRQAEACARFGRWWTSAAYVTAFQFSLWLLLITSGSGQVATKQAGPMEKTWNFQDEARTPDAWNGISVSKNPEVRTPDGESTFRMTAQVASSELEWPAFINCWTNLREVQPGSEAHVSFWLRGPKGTTVDVGAVSERHFSLCERRSLPQTGEWQKADLVLPLRHQEGLRWVALPRITLRQAKAGETIEIGPVHVNIIPPPRP